MTFDSFGAAVGAITNFLIDHGSGLPAPIRERFVSLLSLQSPMDQVVHAAEFIYANAADVCPDARSLAGGLAQFAAVNMWQGMSVDARGYRIALAMARMNGDVAPDGFTFPDESEDPEVRPEFLIPEPEPTGFVDDPETGDEPSSD